MQTFVILIMVATIFVFFYDNSEIETKENMQEKIPLKDCKNGDGVHATLLKHKP